MGQLLSRSLSNEAEGSSVVVDWVLKLDPGSRSALVVGCLTLEGTSSSYVCSWCSAIAEMA